ncbi:hypothetical protein BYT27DRAFT_6854150 [Phlegmacium glaucopus]|nr:hypothetical protein BYT27DRAFT_6854150 [Phlegmacium glaucopus]
MPGRCLFGKYLRRDPFTNSRLNPWLTCNLSSPKSLCSRTTLTNDGCEKPGLKYFYSIGVEVPAHLVYIGCHTALHRNPEPNHLLNKISRMKDHHGGAP